jgi:hypothetical protein
MGIRQRVTGWIGGEPQASRVKEMIGRVVLQTGNLWARRTVKTVDQTRVDYAFWDKLRRGKATGYEFSGLFAKPILEVLVAGVLGRKLTFQLATDADSAKVDYTNELLERLARHLRRLLVVLVEDLYGLGDQYVILNTDGSISLPSPDTVAVTYDAVDYRKMIRVTVVAKLDAVTVVDEYTAAARTVTVRYHDGRDDDVSVYPNLLGRVPVVHLANDRSGNETNGRPVYEALLRLLSRYDDLLNKALDGAELMGNPIPVFSGMEDIDEMLQYNETDEDAYTDADGEEVSLVRLAFDRMAAVILGKGGSFGFASPSAGFTTDVRDMLKSLFLLILEFTRIPEAVWGGELSSARATAEQQMLPFYQMLEKRRTALEGHSGDERLGFEARGGLLEVVELWLQMRALTDAQVVVAPVVIQWDDLYESAEEMRFQWVQYLKSLGLLSDETTVRLSGVVDDATGEIERAAADEVQPDVDTFDARMQEAVDDADLLEAA